MEDYVQVYVNVDNQGNIKQLISGKMIVADAPYDYFFYMPAEEAAAIDRGRVEVDEYMKPQLIKEGE